MYKGILTAILVLIYIDLSAQEPVAVMLNQHTEIKYEKGKLIKTKSFEIQINNRDGDAYSKITIPFSKDNKIAKIEAFIKDHTGKIIRKLKKSEIVEKSAIPDGSFYTDYLVKEFSMRHNTYPHTIFYTYQEGYEQFVHVDDWFPVVSDKVPTSNAGLKLIVPKDFGIRFLQHEVEDPKIEQVGDSIIYLWQATYNTYNKQEIYSSDDDIKFPWVRIVPKNFNYEKPGSFESWISYGNWNHELLEGLDDLSESEKQKIKNLINNINDKKEKIRILYHYLQDETHYVNISIKT